MSIRKKVKKAAKAITNASDKLIQLVNKKASKKKILKQVDKVQDLGKEQKKLKKKGSTAAAKVKSKASKAKTKVKAPVKTTTKKADAASKKLGEELLEKRAIIAKSKKLKSSAKKETAPAKAKIKNKVEEVKATKNNVDNISSSKMNARTAMAKITELSTQKEVDDFIKGEKRKTVLDRANARKNALTEAK